MKHGGLKEASWDEWSISDRGKRVGLKEACWWRTESVTRSSKAWKDVHHVMPWHALTRGLMMLLAKEVQRLLEHS